MANVNIVQSTFSYGELDPKLYAQANFDGYQKGVKSGLNCLTIPQGGFMSRWGTKSAITVDPGTTNYKYVDITGFNYDVGTQYNLILLNNNITITLENTIQAVVVTTYPQEILQQLYYVPVQNRLLIFHQNFATRQLQRAPLAANIITGVNASPVNEIVLTNNLGPVGNVFPISFTTAGNLPTTSPQIYVNTIYFARFTALNTIKVFSTSAEAATETNEFTVTAAGAGVSNVLVQAGWTISNIPFSNLPAYDFDKFAVYTAPGVTFQVSAQAGTLAALTTITCSAAGVFTAAHVGGIFRGGGGVARLIALTGANTMTATTYVSFTVAAGAAGAFYGADAFLGEPAFSATRGYPSCGAYHQERLWMGGSRQIPNGIWGSTLFGVYDFDDSEDLDDNAISDYSSKSAVRAFSSNKSLIVHCDQETNSTPLTANVPLTPRTFNLDEQNKDGVNDIQPVFVDNQIIYVDKSAHNVKNMAWDIVQSSYVNNNISIASSHLVPYPTDMATFSESIYTDGLYVFVVNQDGTLGIYQTLIEQSINAWTPAVTEQNYTTGYFRRVSSVGNRCWFLVERLVPTAQGPQGVFDGGFNSLITAIPIGAQAGSSTLIQFIEGVALPETQPQIVTNTFYWAKMITEYTFRVYSSKEDADADINRFIIINGGNTSSVTAWIDQSRLFIEELDYNFQTDASRRVSGDVPFDELTDLTTLIGLKVQIVADENVLPTQIVQPNATLQLGGFYSDVSVGLASPAEIIPLPISINLGTGPNLYQTKHIRTLYVQYHGTAHFTLQNYEPLGPVVNPPLARAGVYSTALQEGWVSQDFDIVIRKTQPLKMTILGIGYNVETV